jgi:hypothetical protein
MSIASENYKSGPYSATTDTFVVTFPFDAKAELAVYKTVVATGVSTKLTVDSDYTVSGEGDESGGSITTDETYGSAYTITILRDVPLTQLVDLANNATFYPAVIEGGFDRLEQQIQMLAELIDRCYKVSPAESNPDLDAVVETLTAGVRYPLTKTMWGDAQAGSDMVFGKYVPTNDVYLSEVEIEAYAGAPVGRDLILKVKIDGVAQSRDFTLGAGEYHAKIVPNSTELLIPAGKALEWYFSQVGLPANPGTNVTVTNYFRRNV